MQTTCSHCQTRFRVSEAQLKAAHGQVRCGQCHEVFDAYAALLDDSGAALGKADLETPEAPLTAKAGSAPELDVAMAAAAEPAAETPDLVIPARKADAPTIEDLFAGLSAAPHAAPEPPPVPVEFDIKLKPLPEAPELPKFERAVVIATPAPQKRRAGVEFLWSVGGAFMILWLLVQLVDANRASLSQNLVLGPSLQALYAALGRPLAPPRSVSGWNVSALNVTSDPEDPGALSITGALQNQAGFVQPWPELRVVLTDRYGETLRSRDFKPAEYLPASQANVSLAPGQGARFRIDVVDPGADAVGFSLSPCLDLPRGRVCATTEHD